jgi:hypothetical protein
MPWYSRVLPAVQTVAPFLAPTQAINLALLVSALLGQRTLCLTALARAYPTPPERRVAQPKHDLLHRVKRLWRFLANERVDAVAVQTALIPYTVAQLGRPRWLGLAIDWTMFDTTLPTGERLRYQVLRIAVPRRGRALPLLQVAYDRDHLPGTTSQNQLEEAALLAVVEALPPGVRAVVLADRGFARATLFEWLQAHRVDYVVRIDKGTCLTERDGHCWKLGTEGLQLGELRWAAPVRYGLYHGRPRDRWLHVALCWPLPQAVARNPRRQPPQDPWYLATSLAAPEVAVAWYWQRGWIEQSFKDAKQGFGLARVQVGSPERLTRLLMALTLALTWLTLAALPECGGRGLRAAAAHLTQWGRLSLVSLGLARLHASQNLPLACLPRPSMLGGYARGS